MSSLMLNLLIASIWLFLGEQPTLGTFTVGFLVGFVMLAIFHPVIGSEHYVRRCIGLVVFLGIFIRELVMANLSVAHAVLFRSNESIHPNFITYDTTGLRRFEVLFLSYCISLTPGTTVVNISDDFTMMVIHALDADCPEKTREHIDQVLKPAILRITR